METHEEITANNQKIAAFIGLKCDSDGRYHNNYETISKFPFLDYSRNPDELEFHLSWDWLIPAIKKLMEKKAPASDTLAWYNYGDLEDRLIDCDINEAYQKLVSCINYYKNNI